MEKQHKKKEKKKRDSKITKLKKKGSSQSLSKVKPGLSPPKQELPTPPLPPTPKENEGKPAPEDRSETPKRPAKKPSKAKFEELPKKPSSKRVQIVEPPKIPRIISKTGLSPDNTEAGGEPKDPYYTSSMIRRDLYNIMDEADKISEIKPPVMLPPTTAGPGPGLSPNGSAQKGPVSKSLQVTQSDMTGPPTKRSDQIAPQPIRSDLQLPNTIGIVKNAPGGVSAHPLSLVRIDGDLLGRTGMYIERSGMSTAKKRAFDWLGLNRHQYQQKAAETVKNLEVALSDVGISKDLFFQTLNILLADHQITETEIESIKQDLQNSPDFLSMSKAAWILKEKCNTYRRPQDLN